MRQLIKTILMVSLLIPSLGWSMFSDEYTIMALDKAQQQIRESNNFAERLALVGNLRDEVHNRLITMPFPDFTVRGNEDKVENYRSLQEFEVYLDLLIDQRPNSFSCAKSENEIKSASSYKDYSAPKGQPKIYVAPEAQKVLELLRVVCTK